MIVNRGLFEDWLMVKNLKPRTIRNYLYYFMKYDSPKFNQQELNTFLAKYNNTISRAFLKILKEYLIQNSKQLGIDGEYLEEIYKANPPKLTGRFKKKIVKSLTDDEIQKLRQHIYDEELSIMFELTLACGLRVDELMKIRVIDFSWEKWKLDMEKMGDLKVYGKGDKEGMCLVPTHLMVKIAKYITNSYLKHQDVDSYLIQRTTIGTAVRDWEKNLLKASEEAGITRRDANGNIVEGTSVHPHRLRHTFATRLKKKKIDLFDIKELMRHSDVSTTQRYVHTDIEDVQEQHEAILNVKD